MTFDEDETIMKRGFAAVIIVVLFVCLATSSISHAQQTNSLHTQKELLARQEQALLAQYGKALDAIMASLRDKGELDAYLMVETEKKRFDAEKTVFALAQAKDPFRVPVESYCKGMADLLRRYVAALDVLVKQTTKAGRIDDAKAARDEKTRAEFLWADAESKLPQAAPIPPSELRSPPEVASLKSRRLVIWNTHNGPYNDRGATECNVLLGRGETVVWSTNGIPVPWQRNKDTKAEVDLPALACDRVRVEVTKWRGLCGGLAEIEVVRAGKTLTKGQPARASASYVLRGDFGAYNVTDGVKSSAKFGIGYWLLPDNQPGWIEITLPGPLELRH